MENVPTLVVAVLSVASSYSRNFETAAGDPPDTVQWWLDAAGSWRIKTFALDHDIHVHSLGQTELGQLKALAVENTQKHYGDVVSRLVVLEFPSLAPEATSVVLRDAGLGAALEVAPAGFAFWNPDGGLYRTQSRPEEAV
jgi:hypothetical protein